MRRAAVSGRLTSGFIALMVAGTGLIAEERPDAPTIAGIASTMRQQLRTKPASWTAVTHFGSDAPVYISVLQSPPDRRYTFSMDVEGKRKILARLTVRDDVWYVTDEKTRKYLPYGAIFKSPKIYSALARASLLFSMNSQFLAKAAFVGKSGNIATFKVTPDDESKQRLRDYAARLKKALKDDQERGPEAETVEALRETEDYLANGETFRVDAKSGLIVEYGQGLDRTEVRDFEWRSTVDPAEFSAGQAGAVDCIRPVSADARERIMISCDPLHAPENHKRPDFDGYTFDLKSGELRRIPLNGTRITPGFFFKDRTRVVAVSDLVRSGERRMYEVNLLSGDYRTFGVGEVAEGYSEKLALSPDGATVALCHASTVAKINEAQIYLVGVESQRARPLGRPMDITGISWLPDGEGLVVGLHEKGRKASDPDEYTVCVLDLQGEMKRLFSGNLPLVLNEAKRILYADPGDRLWKTRTLDGAGERLFAGGLPDGGFPVVSPDGDEVIFMKFSPDEPPALYRFKVDEGAARVRTLPPGAWSLKAWR